MSLRSWIIGLLAGSIGPAACGPTELAEWTLAIKRSDEGHENLSRIWLIDADGAERRIGDVPEAIPPIQRLLGWSLDGRGFYMSDRETTWFVSEGRFEGLPCDDVPYGCISDDDLITILPEGRMVVGHQVSSSHFPGSTWPAPSSDLPRSHPAETGTP